MSEFLQIRSNGQITLPAQTRPKAKVNEGDLLEVIVEEDGSIALAIQVNANWFVTDDTKALQLWDFSNRVSRIM